MMNGTPAIPAFYTAVPGLDIIRQVGVDRIREKSKQMTGYLLEQIDEHGYLTTTRQRHSFPTPSADPSLARCPVRTMTSATRQASR